MLAGQSINLSKESLPGGTAPFTWSLIWWNKDGRWLQRWSINSHAESEKQYLDLKTDQGALQDELAKSDQVFECATVYWSGESYVTVSATPPLVRRLLRSTNTTMLLCRPFTVRPLPAGLQRSQSHDNRCTHVITAALDPPFWLY